MLDGRRGGDRASWTESDGHGSSAGNEKEKDEDGGDGSAKDHGSDSGVDGGHHFRSNFYRKAKKRSE